MKRNTLFVASLLILVACAPPNDAKKDPVTYPPKVLIDLPAPLTSFSNVTSTDEENYTARSYEAYVTLLQDSREGITKMAELVVVALAYIKAEGIDPDGEEHASVEITVTQTMVDQLAEALPEAFDAVLELGSTYTIPTFYLSQNNDDEIPYDYIADFDIGDGTVTLLWNSSLSRLGGVAYFDYGDYYKEVFLVYDRATKTGGLMAGTYAGSTTETYAYFKQNGSEGTSFGVESYWGPTIENNYSSASGYAREEGGILVGASTTSGTSSYYREGFGVGEVNHQATNPTTTDVEASGWEDEFGEWDGTDINKVGTDDGESTGYYQLNALMSWW